VAVGDFNGDGLLDLAVTNTDDGTVSILLGTGTGSFGVPTPFDVGSQPVSVAVGDFNGDGTLDLAVANKGEGTVSVIGGTAGVLAARTPYTVGRGPSFVGVGDFNGDGHLDLAVANYGDNTVSILLGTGNGAFRTATRHKVGRGPAFVGVGDFNGDGHLDLAVANYGDNRFRFSQQGRAASASRPSSTPALLRSNRIADFNGDGHLDLAIENRLSQQCVDTVGHRHPAGSGASTGVRSAGLGQTSTAMATSISPQ
jgi:hypothetical protein